MKKSFLFFVYHLIIATAIIMTTTCKKEDENNLIKDVDGNEYHTVTIGDQVWFKENLRTTKLNNGSSITLEADKDTWASLTGAAYCWYDNEASIKGKTYGALYNYAAVTSGKLCPAGWHVPSKTEWEILRNIAGGENLAGGKLKEQGTAHWNNPNTGATDELKFTALPSGERYEDGDYVYLGINNNFWSTTIGPGTDPFGVRMYNDSQIFHLSEFHKGRGLSVRCVKD